MTRPLASDMDQGLKYPWQQLVLDAYMEFRPEVLPTKLAAAERAIAARLRENLELEEQIALNDALRALQVLLPDPEAEEKSRDKKDTA